MEAKVKKLFSETYVKTYDYPFIIGFLEANGINGIVPSFEQNENRALLSYDKFKQWWKQNCAQKQQKDTVESVNEANPDSVNIEYIVAHGGKSVVIDMTEAVNEFVKYNTEQAERVLFDRPHFKDLGHFLRKHIISDILD